MEQNEYLITKPSVYMLEYPSFNSPVCDELLYGTKVTVLSEHGSFFRLKTSYGYSGYLPKSKLTYPNETKHLYKYFVNAVCCDFLSFDAYKAHIILTVPKGAVVFSEKRLSMHKTFFPVIHKKSTYFVSSKLLSEKPESRHKNNGLLRKTICDNALFYLGTPYRWGGKSSFGIDCSGLCFMSYMLCNLPLWRDSYPDPKFVHEISKNDLLPGDLIYFDGHMALFIGDDEYVHSSASTGYVTINSLNENSFIYRQDLANKVVMYARSNFL